jgi:hypothetical protein
MKVEFHTHNERGEFVSQMYRVITDESHFESFKELGNKIVELGNIFQNPDAIVPSKEVVNWIDQFSKCYGDLDQLKKSINRFVEIEKE